MSRRQDHQVSAGLQPGYRHHQLGCIVLDVLEHVDVEDRVELRIGGHRVHRPLDDRAAVQLRPPALQHPAQALGHPRIGLQAHPPLAQGVRSLGVRAQAGPDLEHLPPYERPHL